MKNVDVVSVVEKIVKIPEPERLWVSKDKDKDKIIESEFWGYKTNMFFKWNNKISDKKICYGQHFIIANSSKKTLEVIKREAKIDVARILLWGCDSEGKEINKDCIVFPEIKMTEEQFKKIRKIGEELAK